MADSIAVEEFQTRYRDDDERESVEESSVGPKGAGSDSHRHSASSGIPMTRTRVLRPLVRTSHSERGDVGKCGSIAEDSLKKQRAEN